jgi:hypothetical protein
VNALSSNMLSGVILVIIALNYPTLQKIVELKLIEADTEETSDTALVVPDFANGDMPLYMRINVESWIKLINDTIFANPVRNLQSIKNRQNPEVPVLGLTNLLSYIIQDYLQQHKLDFDGAAADKFIKAIASNLLFRLDQHVLQTKNLTSTNENPA